MSTLKERMAEKMAASGDVVANMVLDQLTKKELEKRRDAIVNGMAKLEEAEKAVENAKPDNKQFDIDGRIVSETYTQKGLQNLNSAKKKAAQYKSAIDKALNENDFTALTKAFSGKSEDATSAGIDGETSGNN